MEVVEEEEEEEAPDAEPGKRLTSSFTKNFRN